MGSYMQKIYWINKGFSDEEAKNRVLFEVNKRCKFKKEYWINKGLSEDEAQEKVKEIQSLNNKKRKNIKNTMFTIEHWINKGLTDDEAQEKISNLKKKNPRKVSYWLDKGFSDEDAKNKVSELQKHSASFVNYKNIVNPQKEEYWLKRGIIKEDIDKVKKEFNKRYSVTKNTIGKESYDNMILNRKKAYSNWTNEFKKDLNNRRQIGISNFYKNGGTNKKYSKISLELFVEIEKRIGDICLYGEKEKYCRIGDNNYFLDFTYKNKCIEFFGNYCHANPSIYEDDFILKQFGNLKTAAAIRESDKIRINNISSKYDVLIIWESEYFFDKEKTINKCIQWINT